MRFSNQFHNKMAFASLLFIFFPSFVFLIDIKNTHYDYYWPILCVERERKEDGDVCLICRKIMLLNLHHTRVCTTDIKTHALLCVKIWILLIFLGPISPRISVAMRRCLHRLHAPTSPHFRLLTEHSQMHRSWWIE